MTRLSIGLGVAVAIAVVLHLALGGTTASSRPQIDESAAFEAGGAVSVAVPATVGLPTGRPWLIYLARRDRALPGAVAPVVELRPGGALQLVRGPPIAERPDRADQRWLAAGLILPVARLDALSATERAALLTVLRRWSRGAGWDRARIACWGVAAEPFELDGLGRWAR